MKMTPEAKELRRAYERERYKNDPDRKKKQRDRMARYWNNKAEELKKQQEAQNEPQPMKL